MAIHLTEDKREKLNDPVFLAELKKLGLDSSLVDSVLEKASRLEYYINKFVTNDPAMLRLKDQIKKLAHVNDPVLIQGPSGTGKELLANALHNQRNGLFLAVNCAGLPENLIESELFGHVKGSFTGSIGDKEGILEAAKNGTVFLDEIGDLPLALQAKLLRAIQEMVVRKVGSNEEVPISCRFVCATHHRLFDCITDKTFRNDLYWRISTFTLNTTALTERVDDIPLIIKALDTENKIQDISAFILKIDRGNLGLGNVRVLQQAVRKYYVLGE